MCVCEAVILDSGCKMRRHIRETGLEEENRREADETLQCLLIHNLKLNTLIKRFSAE